MLPTDATTGGNAARKTWAAKALLDVRKHFEHPQMMGSASSPELTSQDLQATNSAHPAGAAHFLGDLSRI